MRDYWITINKESKDYFYNKEYHRLPELAKMFKNAKAKKILDMGSGYGRNFVYLAKRGFDVYGFDNSKMAIGTLKARLKKENLRGHLKKHDFNNRFPYPDGFFDAALSIAVLHHSTYEKVRRAAAELSRVVKKGGIVFISAPEEKSEAMRFKRIGYRTYLPLDGREKGVVHFYFTKPVIRRFFRDFKLKIKLAREPARGYKGKLSMRWDILGVKI